MSEAIFISERFLTFKLQCKNIETLIANPEYDFSFTICVIKEVTNIRVDIKYRLNIRVDIKFTLYRNQRN